MRTAAPIFPRNDAHARLRRTFVAATASLVLVFAGSGTPIPLFNTYRTEDGITNADLAWCRWST